MKIAQGTISHHKCLASQKIAIFDVDLCYIELGSSSMTESEKVWQGSNEHILQVLCIIKLLNVCHHWLHLWWVFVLGIARSTGAYFIKRYLYHCYICISNSNDPCQGVQLLQKGYSNPYPGSRQQVTGTLSNSRHQITTSLYWLHTLGH